VNFFWDLEEARSHILIMAEAVASVELSADRASDEIGWLSALNLLQARESQRECPTSVTKL
jgi:hypothetical protein